MMCKYLVFMYVLNNVMLSAISLILVHNFQYNKENDNLYLLSIYKYY